MTGLATAALPVTAIVLSALVLGEHLGPVHVLGAAAVIAGILIGRRQPGPKGAIGIESRPTSPSSSCER
jgi:drug/metabolite transporter (DMT)-like permease